jgi:nickel-dependent lactate racemase
MQLHMTYGDDGLDVELPDSTDVITPIDAPSIIDVPAALREALTSPMNSAPLAELVDADDHVAIVFSDITRPVPNHVLAPEILRVVEGQGVPRDRITLIVGSGLHREMTPDELERTFGAAIVRDYRIVTHDARDRDGVTFLQRYPGEPRGGVYLNTHYMRASVKIVTGFVEPHLFAGYSGGGKGVFPGVAAAHNIMRNHGVANLMHESATYGVAAGNPLFEEMRAVALSAGVTFLCNVTANADKSITGIYCGELVAAHEAAMAQVREHALRPVPTEYDIVVCTNGGYPADLNLYQAVKAMVAAERAVRQGGAIVLASECREGVGGQEYIDLLALADTPEGLMELMLQPEFHMIDQWQAQEQIMVQRKADVHVYSSLDAATVRASQLIPCADISATVNELAAQVEREQGRAATILAMPFGFQAIPVVEEGIVAK